MNTLDARQLLIDVFVLLHKSDFKLGIGELLSALRTIDEERDSHSQEELYQAARLLWCHSPLEEATFKSIWANTLATTPKANPEPASTLPDHQPEQSDVPAPARSMPTSPDIPPTFSPNWDAVIVTTPPALAESMGESGTYQPVSRHAMIYTWRTLLRHIPDGPADILDVKSTVEQTARQSFFLKPIYQQRRRAQSHLILLVDQGGSMVPYHYFTRDLVATAQSVFQQLQVGYFHNAPAGVVYQDPHLTTPIAWETLLAQCSRRTGVLIVSDAGAARGYRRWERIGITARFVQQLKHYTRMIAWLNPMPRHRWLDTSAQRIERLVPMFQVDPTGFSTAINVIRGQFVRSDF